MTLQSSRWPRTTLSIAAFLWLGTECRTKAAAEGWKLEVRPAVTAKGETPILTPAPARLPEGTYVVKIPGQDAALDAQVFEDSGRWLVLLGRGPIPEGGYELSPTSNTSDDPRGTLKVIPQDGNLRFEIFNGRFTDYRTDVGAKPYLFPLIGPSGAPYTRAYPMADVPGEDHDHPHQRSFWFTHGNVNGVDFWSEQTAHGSIRETSRKLAASGPLAARLRTTDDWLAPDGKKVCEDERVLTLYRTRSVRVLDFDVTIKAVDGPVTFGDTKEGMFGLRVASSMDVNRKQGGRIVNAEGLTDEPAWGKASPWVDYTGPVAGKPAGIAILNHPRSFRHPTTWHVRTYGLFAANPFGWHDFGMGKSGAYTLPAGQSLYFGYRVILHEGTTGTAEIAELYRQYANPGAVKVAGP